MHSEYVDSWYTTVLNLGGGVSGSVLWHHVAGDRHRAKCLCSCVQNQGCSETTCHTMMNTARNTQHLLHVHIQILIFWLLHVQKPFIVVKYLVDPPPPPHIHIVPVPT